MYARVSTFEGSPDQVDDQIREAREKVAPAVRGIPGSKGLLALVDRVTGKTLAITLWESEHAMKESEEAADRIRRESAEVGGERIASVERFEVAILETT